MLWGDVLQFRTIAANLVERGLMNKTHCYDPRTHRWFSKYKVDNRIHTIYEMFNDRSPGGVVVTWKFNIYA